MDLTAFNKAFFADATQTSAVFTHGATVATINVIFDNEFSVMGIPGIEEAQPQAQCKTSDVSAAVHNDTLVIGGVTYYIKGIEPDGLGVTTLILSKSNVD